MTGVDIRNTVSVGIGLSNNRAMYEISAKTVGHSKPWPFAKQNDGKLCAKQRADLILNGYPGLGNGADRTKCKFPLPKRFDQVPENLRAVPLGGVGG